MFSVPYKNINKQIFISYQILILLTNERIELHEVIEYLQDAFNLSQSGAVECFSPVLTIITLDKIRHNYCLLISLLFDCLGLLFDLVELT